MADLNAELTSIVGTLTGMIVELYARQLALVELLQSHGTKIDEREFRQAVARQHAELARRPTLARFRSEVSASNLEVIEKALAAMLPPKA